MLVSVGSKKQTFKILDQIKTAWKVILDLEITYNIWEDRSAWRAKIMQPTPTMSEMNYDDDLIVS